jgi:Raf kinase inhibitor-like YbhB/YbcL family protein
LNPRVAIALALLFPALGTVGVASAQPLTVSSPALADNGMLATANAASERDCGGQNVSPPLRWSNAPAGTRSFAVVMTDPDGGRGLGSVHWMAYGVAPTVMSLAEGAGGAPSQTFIGGMNSAGSTNYRGPCPPVGDQPHHYVIGVYALDLAPDALKPGLSRDAFLEAIRGHSLAEASLIGRYAR